METYYIAESLEIIQHLYLWCILLISFGFILGVVVCIYTRERNLIRKNMEKTIFSVGKFLGKLKVRAKQNDLLAVKKILDKSGISDDDKYLLKIIESNIFFER